MGGVGKVVGSVFGGGDTPKAPVQKLEEELPAPTVDEGRAAAEDELNRDRRRGRLSTYLTPTSTGEQLAAGTGNSLKRFLGA